MNIQVMVPELFEWMEVFRAGKHIDSQGNETTWTEGNLDDIVANFQPNTFSVPIVLGHQTSDASPAYGWVSHLKKEGDRLYAKLANVLETFAISFKNKQYPNRSVRIDQTDRGFELGHLAFLGAVPPAIELQPAIQFKRYISSHEFPVPSPEAPPTQPLSLITGELTMAMPIKQPDGKEVAMETETKQPDKTVSEDATPPKKTGDPQAANEKEPLNYELAIDQPPVVADANPPRQPDLTKPMKPPAPTTPPPGMVIMSEHERQLLLNQGVASAAEAMLASAQLFVSQLQAAGKVTPALLDGIADFICFLERIDSPNPIFAYAASVNPKLAAKKVTYQNESGQMVEARPVDFFKSLLEKLPTQYQNSRHDYAAMPVADPAQQFNEVVQHITAGYRQPPTAFTPTYRGMHP